MKLPWKNKLPSGALQFTIFISVVIALLLAGVVILTYTHRYFIEQAKFGIQNIQLTDTGINSLLLAESTNSDTINLSLPDTKEQESLKVHLSPWGLFEKAYTTAVSHKKKYVKCALLGTGLKEDERLVLYLQETFKPLVVVGNAKVEGIAYLPEQGIKTGNINGHSYYGSQLVYGSIKTSTPEMPKLKYDYRLNLESYLKESKFNFIPLERGKKSRNSFNEPIKGYFSQTPIILKDIILQGNIIIRSGSKITVQKSAVLKDVILVAPEIIIEDNVSGNFQVIADTSIQVGKDCNLGYPSALILLEKEQAHNQYDRFNNKIYIDQGSNIGGSICFFKRPENEVNYLVNVFVNEQSSIKGEIYCEGNLELKGSVLGSVFTNQFIAYEGGTIFVNHIYNGRISSKNLPEEFGGVLFENKPKTIMKWLY